MGGWSWAVEWKVHDQDVLSKLLDVTDNALFRNAERREDVRIGAHVEVKFQAVAQAAKALSTFSVNFSAGGLCLRTKAVHAKGDRLALTITIAEDVLDLQGVVAWVKADVIGIRFVDLTPVARQRLEQVAKALVQKNPLVP